MVGGADLHVGRPGLSPFADGCIYGAPGRFAARFCFDCANRRQAPGEIAGQSVVGISRLDLDYRLRSVRARLRRGGDVPCPRTATQDSPVALDILSSPAVAQSVFGHDAAALVRVHSLYRGVDQRIFRERAAALDQNCPGDCDLGFVRSDFAEPVFTVGGTAAGRYPLHGCLCDRAVALVEH